MKDIKHIRPDFHSTPWSYPRVGTTVGGWGGGGGGGGGQNNFFLKFNKSWCVSYLHEWHMQQHIFWGVPRPLGPWGGAKGQILLNLNYLVNFKYF